MCVCVCVLPLYITDVVDVRVRLCGTGTATYPRLGLRTTDGGTHGGWEKLRERKTRGYRRTRRAGRERDGGRMERQEGGEGASLREGWRGDASSTAKTELNGL